MKSFSLLGIAAAASMIALPSFADDSAASIAAGGLVPRREVRVVMAKEVLRISPDKVIVDYDFRNDSDEDVTTEVAFPIPSYKNEFPYGYIPEQAFQSFQLWVDDSVKKFESEAKATLGGKDVTEALRKSKIDIATLGHFDEKDQPVTRDFERLPVSTRKDLIKQGLFSDEGDSTRANAGAGLVLSTWTVDLQYHWTQVFPAHSTVHIRHEYSPAIGFQMLSLDAFKKALAAGGTRKPMPLAKDRGEDDLKTLMSFCPEPSLLRNGIQILGKLPAESGGYAYPQWVDFILTSANTWKQPIEDFTLIVERGKPVDGYGKPMDGVKRLISFCSPQNTEVKRTDADHFEVHLTNFIPKSELHIGFFDF
jgi:hypothetical protein